MQTFAIQYNGSVAMILLPIIFMLADMVTGFGAALVKRKLDSSKMRSGLFKKVCELLSIFVVLAVTDMTNLPNIIGPFTSTYICYYELLSIVENIESTGIKLPKILTRFLSKANKQLEEGDKASAEDKQDNAMD